MVINKKPKYFVGDHVKWKSYVGEIILISLTQPEGIYKVMFDAPDGPDYWYYPEDELELVESKNVKSAKGTAR